MESLGGHIFQHFLEAKQIEWDIYRTQVYDWELEQYLNNY
jgi:glutamine synthetase